MSVLSYDLATFQGSTGLVRGRADGNGSIVWSAVPNIPVLNDDVRGQFLGAEFLLLNSGAGYGGAEGIDVGVSNDNGRTYAWQHVTFGTLPFRSARFSWAVASDDVWASGNEGWLVQSNNLAASTWRTAAISVDPAIPITKRINAIWGTGANDIWAVGDGLAFHKVSPSKGAP
ncbi:hypothetical protein AKJ09_01723 [Labilithrix luteola]|uniref:Exo-alpha-sialidase n=1 Tax=Labilithrix luteola TaxID=1391654 RepID=A0A0K1PPK8_9BACT|nr:hypothetical protein [Labilithrix luteola]AKU95059.1 hypothetical protein AKJ09_01723 [Labilithrix luteola]